MRIDYRQIPSAEMREGEPMGDYWWEGEDLHIRVVDTGNERYNFLVFQHELVESMLGKFAKVPEPDSLKFDEDYERRRLTVGVRYEEPGNDPSAPYYQQHQAAEVVERFLAQTMGINWEEYSEAFDKLG
jgi:hypothetical protein